MIVAFFIRAFFILSTSSFVMKVRRYILLTPISPDLIHLKSVAIPIPSSFAASASSYLMSVSLSVLSMIVILSQVRENVNRKGGNLGKVVKMVTSRLKGLSRPLVLRQNKARFYDVLSIMRYDALYNIV